MPKRPPARWALGALASVLAACGALDGPAPLDCENLQCIQADRAYSYRPTREARRPVATVAPGAEVLPESAYDAIESGPTHSVTFSADLMQVELVAMEGAERLVGTQQERTSDRIAYDLDAFAGGALIVRWDQPTLEAELTLFGSGVPITSSSRGVLAPQPSKD